MAAEAGAMKHAMVPIFISFSLLVLSYVATWKHAPFLAVITFVLSALFAAAGKQTARVVR